MRVARAQWGLVSIVQIRAQKLSKKWVASQVRLGRWRRVHRGVYQTGQGPLGLHQKEVAALLAAGPTAVLSHHNAARWWRIATPSTETIHVTVPMAHSHRPIDGLTLHYCRGFADGETKEMKPLRLTTRARTLLDLAEVLEPHESRASLESCLREDRQNLSSILRTLKGHADGRSGALRLLEIASEYLGPQKVPDSVLESYAMELGLATGRKPIVRPNIFNADRFIAEVDLAWPEVRLCAELDGYQWHSSHEAFEKDHRKTRELQEAGWTVRRYTWREVDEQKQMVINSLAAAYREASERRVQPQI